MAFVKHIAWVTNKISQWKCLKYHVECKSCLAAFLAYLPCLRFHDPIQEINESASSAWYAIHIPIVQLTLTHRESQITNFADFGSIAMRRLFCSFFMYAAHYLPQYSVHYLSLTIIYCFIHDNLFNLCEFLVSICVRYLFFVIFD